MTDRGDVGAAHLQCLPDGGCELRIAELTAHADHLDHGACAMLSSPPFDQLIPDPVVALGPAALRPPLRQRRRTAQRARLALQHIEVVLQIEDLLLTAVATRG